MSHERDQLVADLSAYADKLAAPVAVSDMDEWEKGFYVARMSAATGIRTILDEAKQLGLALGVVVGDAS